jgi:16S rRNA (guanine527-N7)-methyltransferase
LERRARLAGISIPEALGIKLETYYRLLDIWNRKVNLTGMNLADASPEALDRLLVEPVMAARYANPGVRIIDIGSGGGSPAIPFMLAVPGRGLLMVESKARKSAFLREAVRALDLTYAEVATARYESLLSEHALHEAYELLTIRAVRVEQSVLMSLQTFVKPGGEIFLFRSATDELPRNLTPPPLTRFGSFPLVQSLGSQVTVLQKSPG